MRTVLQIHLRHEKVFAIEVNVFRLCIGIFTSACSYENGMQKTIADLTETWNAILTQSILHDHIFAEIDE